MTAWSLDSPRRLAALAEVDVFPGSPADVLGVYPRLVARLVDVPMALVSFVSDQCQFFPASTGLSEPWVTQRQTPLSMSLCQHVVQSDADFIVTDAARDPRVKDSLAVTEFGVRAYFGVPLRAPGGEPVGALCAIDTRPRRWTPAHVAAMHDLTTSVASTIAMRVSEHRRAAAASEASHDLRTPLTRLRFELDDLGHVTDVDAAVAQVQELSGVVEGIANAVRRAPVRNVEIELVSLCRDVASQRDATHTAAAPVRVEGVPTVVRSVRAILHHVVALLVGSFGGGQLTIVVGSDAGAARIQLRSADSPSDGSAVEATRRLLLEQLGGRLVERPSADVAFEIVLPRRAA